MNNNICQIRRSQSIDQNCNNNKPIMIQAPEEESTINHVSLLTMIFSWSIFSAFILFLAIVFFRFLIILSFFSYSSFSSSCFYLCCSSFSKYTISFFLTCEMGPYSRTFFEPLIPFLYEFLPFLKPPFTVKF